MTLFDQIIAIFWPLQLLYYLCILIGVFLEALWAQWTENGKFFLGAYGWFGAVVALIYLVSLYPLVVDFTKALYRKMGGFWKTLSILLVGDGGLIFMTVMAIFTVGILMLFSGPFR